MNTNETTTKPTAADLTSVAIVNGFGEVKITVRLEEGEQKDETMTALREALNEATRVLNRAMFEAKLGVSISTWDGELAVTYGA